MVFCKFFMQGTCRFGNSCKFDHQIPSDNSFGGGQSILLQNYASKPQQQQPQQQQTGSNVDTNTIIKMVVNDMTLAEKGGQWLLSTYSPFKEKPQFPGFEDHSMEEIRFFFLEAVKNGTVEQYKQNLQMMLQQAMVKIKALQNPTPEAVNILRQIYSTPVNGEASTLQNQTASGAFGNNNNGSSVFGGGVSNNQNNTFATQPPQQSSIFGGANMSVFQSQPQTNSTSIFGGQTSAPSSGIFSGQSQSTSIFGGGNTSVFAASPPPAAPAVFQGAQTANNTNRSIFGGGVPQNQSIFATPVQQPPQQSIFATPQPQVAQTSSIFGQPQQQMQAQQSVNVFQQAPVNIFQQQQPPQQQQQHISPGNVAFGVPPASTQQSQQAHTLNMFGGASGIQKVQTNGFGVGVPSQPNPQDDRYSKLSDLTREEIDWFESDDLDISKIPEKPPTYEMCFKS